MKKIWISLIVLMIMALFSVNAFCGIHDEKAEEIKIESICPKTRIQGEVGDEPVCFAAVAWRTPGFVFGQPVGRRVDDFDDIAVLEHGRRDPGISRQLPATR